MSHRALWALAALSLGIAPGALVSGTAVAENRIALVIGNSAYETVTALPNPANDAKAMGDLLASAGFEVVSAPNLSQNEMRQAISNFAGIAAGKGPDSVTLVFYAGHGLQMDGENYLVPIDARIQREADVPLQATRLADLMTALASVPSKTRIVVLDACRNNPFSDINKTSGRGLAIVDAPNGSLVSYSTAPGTEAQDGDGANSPFTAALLIIAKEPGVPLEQALKRVRLAVNKATDGKQTPWESSSLTGDFFFFPGQGAMPAGSKSEVGSGQAGSAAGRQSGTARAHPTRSVDSWRQEFRSRQPSEAYDIVIQDGTPEAFEAYLAVYSVAPFAGRVRGLLDRRREMIAWYTAVTINSVASYQAFLADYANSDLAITAQRLIERARSRSLASLAVGPACSCSQPAPAQEKRTKGKKKEKQASRSSDERPAKRGKRFISDEEIGTGPSPRPVGGGGPPISIGIGRMPMGGSSGGGRTTTMPGRPMGTQGHRY